MLFFSVLEWLIFVLALAGLAISLYFTFAYYGRIQKARWIPEILCAREGSSCVTVVQTPYARVFGVPNSLLGIIYYTVLILWALANRLPELFGENYIATYLSRADLFLLFISLLTVLLGFYLVFALRRKLFINCPLCYTAHAVNLAIFALLFCDVVFLRILSLM